MNHTISLNLCDQSVDALCELNQYQEGHGSKTVFVKEQIRRLVSSAIFKHKRDACACIAIEQASEEIKNLTIEAL